MKGRVECEMFLLYTLLLFYCKWQNARLRLGYGMAGDGVEGGENLVPFASWEQFIQSQKGTDGRFTLSYDSYSNVFCCFGIEMRKKKFFFVRF